MLARTWMLRMLFVPLRVLSREFRPIHFPAALLPTSGFRLWHSGEDGVDMPGSR